MAATPEPISGATSESGSPSRAATVRSVAVLVLVVLLAAGIAAAGSYGGARLHALPVFAIVVFWIFAVQLIAFIPAWFRQTEKFFDLVGSLTYISSIAAALILSGHTDLSAVLLAAAVIVWAARLGSFLFSRVRRSGSDDRFDELKPNFARFLNVWMMQGLWVTVTISAALAAVTALERPEFGALAAVGLAIWLIGFIIEVVADVQKSRFRADRSNEGTFIRTGLWAWSRHPNYFGEIVLWLGIAVAALPALAGWQYVTLISPIFVVVLLTRISGIPLLERKAEARWGGDPEYQRYVAATPRLVPRPPSTPASPSDQR